MLDDRTVVRCNRRWLARSVPERVRFDGAALMTAVTARRDECDLSWPEAADAIHDQSNGLNAELGDHRMCSGALVRTVRRGTMSCQYALPLLRWLGRAPEDFLVGPVHDVGPTALPAADAHQRLRWDLAALHAELDAHRRGADQTWTALATEVGCSASRLTNLRTARLADMDLTMQLTQRLRRPAASFVEATDW